MTDDATTPRRQATDRATDQAVKAAVCAVIGITSLGSGVLVARIPSGDDQAQASGIVTISVFMVLTGVTLLAFSVMIWRRRARPPGAEELAFRRARAEFACGVIGLAIGVASAVWSAVVAFRPQWGSEALFALLPLGLLIPTGYLLMARARRRLHELRRLAGLPRGAGTSLPVSDVVVRSDEATLYLDAEAGRIAVHLSPLQDLSGLPAAGETVEVLGDPAPGATVLVRPPNGPLLWPRTDGSLFGSPGRATGA